ncbi:ClpP/crotonase-like domain-containing protein [Protomyces lactucae-debilis]|uniref:ClpP/crotonase-like domain-containing protein n=1 Tax=Protomyces lactucae-debilis TaxID=2754530 RepID=A0A1Y2FIJ0_PROLT|nr:ClpP/crotonase-like domain-containing protein [Protomyces lactucae-debilis]ORY83770.1 ClpP/crotonase-like domain-containing protein [Protomyces lactucae-debilis]
MKAEYTQPNFKVSFPSEYVLHVQIDRPKKLNAFNDALWYSLRAIFDAAAYDEDVRCIVLSGNGRAFTAGLDIEQASIVQKEDLPDAARQAFKMRPHILDFQDAITSIQRCLKPVIAAAHGICYGLAIDILSACDIRYASNCARLSIREVSIGLAADIGSLQRLPYVVGNSSWLRDMALSADEFSADEALKQGLLSRVFQGQQATIDGALQRAMLIAEKSPVAVQGTKYLLDYSREHTVAEGLEMSAVWNANMLQTKDMKDAITAVLQKKKPKFHKL